MNLIGVSCPDFSKMPFDEMYGIISKNFSHWEIFSEVNHYAPLVSSSYSTLIQNSEMTFSIHTGIGDINIASTNELIREASVTNIVSELKAANYLGVDTVTVHPGVVNMAVKGIRDISIEKAQKSLRTIEKAAVEYGIFACIENMPNIPVMLGVEADELFRIVDGTELPICFAV